MPNNHNCEKEEVFAQIKENNDKIYKTLFGNGQPGLVQSVYELSGHIKTFNEGMPEVKKQMDDFLKFKISEEACKRGRYKNLQILATWLGLFILITFNVLNLMKSSSNSMERGNIVITNPTTLNEAIQEGKDVNIPADEIKRQHDKKYQDDIKNMNK